MLTPSRGRSTSEETHTQVQPAERLVGLATSQEDLLTFLGLFTHDVGGSVGAASLAVETLRNRGDQLAPELREELLSYLDGRLHRLDALMRDLRALAASGRPLRNPVAVNLAELVEAELEHVETAGRSLTTDLSAAPLRGAPEELALMARKLLDNAFTHTPIGAHAWVSLSADDDRVRLVVEDDGPGVPQELRARIWAPFNRGDAPRTRFGLGIGLAIVADVVAKHRGALGVGDRPGGGARFVVELPRPTEAPEDVDAD